MQFPLVTRVAYRSLPSVLSLLLLLSSPSVSHAGCGCDKPPPPPAAVIPHAAFPGMAVTLSHPNLRVGQTWTVTFRNGTTAITRTARVALKRAITDPTGRTRTPQITIAVPAGALPGPTSIVAARSGALIQIPPRAFTVTGKPISYAERNVEYMVNNYTTAVGADGVLYMAVKGLNTVCKAMKFQTRLMNYPLRFGNGDIVIMNSQGFLVDDLLDPDDPTLGVRRRFSLIPEKKEKSDRLIYRRHSFAQYCATHRPGGAKAVDPTDANWHKDGTPHVDYSTLIFAIDGYFDNGTTPTRGSVSFGLQTESEIDTTNAAWTIEIPEEGVR